LGPALESHLTLGYRTPAHKEFLATAVHHIASLSGTHPLTLEAYKPELAREILDSALAGHIFDLLTLEQTQLPELYVSAATMIAEANTIITQNLDTYIPVS
jgi:hypothetical protein